MYPPLIDYLIANSAQVARPLGQADVIYFGVLALEGATADALQTLIDTHQGGEDIDPLDGREHSYLEIGRWLGDQGLALRLIGLGAILGLWRLLTPVTLLPELDDDRVQNLAGCGWVSLRARVPA